MSKKRVLGPSYVIPNILSGKDFDDALQRRIKSTRKFIYEHHKLITIDTQDDITLIKLFGGLIVYRLDRLKKRLTCYKEQSTTPSKVAKLLAITDATCESHTDFPLFISTHHFHIEVKRLIAFKLESEMVIDKMVPMAHHDDVIRRTRCDPYNSLDIITELRRQESEIKSSVAFIQNTCWSKNTPFKRAVGIIGKVLWEQLDKEIAGYALKIGGRTTTAFDYTLVWSNLDEVRKVAEHSPGLLPIWGRIDSTIPITERSNIVADVKRYLEHDVDDPLSKKAWKYLLKLKPMWVMYLWKQQYGPLPRYTSEGTHTYTFNDILDLYAEVGVIPRFTTFLRMARLINGRKRCPALVAFIRAAFTISPKKPAKAFFVNEVSLAWDWYKYVGVELANKDGKVNTLRARDRDDDGFDLGVDECDIEPVLDRNQLTAPWSWFMRQQKDWHQRVVDNDKVKVLNSHWHSLVAQCEIKGHLVVPLQSAHELYDEGKSMKHCVASYSRSCESGQSRIFSIRDKTDNRLATFEIAHADVYSGPPLVVTHASMVDHASIANPDMTTDDYVNCLLKWQVIQTRGPCNAPVSKLLTGIAANVAQQYSRAVKIEFDKRKHNLTSQPVLQMVG